MCLNKHNFNDRYKNIFVIYLFITFFTSCYKQVTKILGCKKEHAGVKLVLKVHDWYSKYNIYINVGPGKG